MTNNLKAKKLISEACKMITGGANPQLMDLQLFLL